MAIRKARKHGRTHKAKKHCTMQKAKKHGTKQKPTKQHATTQKATICWKAALRGEDIQNIYNLT